MPRYALILIILIRCCSNSFGQNMVTNPGFESYNHCPSARGQITASPLYDTFTTVTDWVDPTLTTPDYFNRCGTDATVRLPFLKLDGYHEPRTGNGCAGISVFSGNLLNDTTDYWSEYLETRLSAPMIANHTYYVSFYVCLTYHGREYYNIISVQNIGARITTVRTDTASTGPMYYMEGMEDIQMPPGLYISDTANWTLISGIYKAQGGEQWLTIGRFYTGTINYKLIHSPTPDSPDLSTTVCYMLVDDVCTIDMEYPAEHDTMIYTPEYPISLGTGAPAGQYLWDNGDTAQLITVQAGGKYVRHRWTECGYYADTFTVAGMPVENCLWMPTAFTPNGDGKNDRFGPGNNYCQQAFVSFSFAIYNRWGQKVFETNNAGEKWDGAYEGRNAETGTYFYTLHYDYGAPFTALNSNAATAPKLIKGEVTLIR